MGAKSKIEWTDDTWNPVTGCDKVSQGCKLCYAERMAHRLQKMGANNYANGFKLTLQPHMLDIPLRTKRPRFYFVNSMSDLFHKDIPIEYLQQVFDVMVRAPHHKFQVLTKRGERLAEVAKLLPWPDNVWMGVSVEDANNTDRIDCLRSVPANVRFLSCEPLLGPIPNMDLAGIDWVIVGGESQPGCRPMNLEWAQGIVDRCREAGKACFVKQLGGHPDKRGDMDVFPEGLKVRQMPEFHTR